MLPESTAEVRDQTHRPTAGLDFPEPKLEGSNQWNPDFKDWVVKESDKPGADFARLSQQIGNGVMPQHIHTWRYERNKKNPEAAVRKRKSSGKRRSSHVLGTTVFRTGVEDLTDQLLLYDQSIASCYDEIEKLKHEKEELAEKVIETLINQRKV